MLQAGKNNKESAKGRKGIRERISVCYWIVILYGIETRVDSSQGTLTWYKDSLMGTEKVSGVGVNSVTFWLEGHLYLLGITAFRDDDLLRANKI